MSTQFANNASTTLASGITAVATSLTVAGGTGALFPTPAGSAFFYATLVSASGTLEIVKVTARTSDTFTIVRGQDGTTASIFTAGAKVELRLVAAVMNNFPQLDATNTFTLPMSLDGTTGGELDFFWQGAQRGFIIGTTSRLVIGTPDARAIRFRPNVTDTLDILDTGITAYAPITLSTGTANGVAYLNGSKVLTTGTALTFDGTNFEVDSGVDFSRAIVLSSDTAGSAFVTARGANGIDYNTDLVFQARSVNTVGSFIWQSGLAGSYTEQMRLTSTGLGIGTSSPGYKLHVIGGNATGFLLDNGGQQYTQLLLQRNSTTNTGGDILIDGTNALMSFRMLAVGAMTFNTSATAGNATERMRLDTSGNLGLGVTPSAWGGGYKSYTNLLYGEYYSSNGGYVGLAANAYYNGTNWIYKNTTRALRYEHDISNSAHTWYTAPSGTVGTAITFTQAMTLDASGNLGVGTTNPGGWRLNATQTGTNALNLINSTSAGVQIQMGDINWSGGINMNSGYLVFQTAGLTERMRLDASGNLGLGVTPSGWSGGNKVLQIAGSGHLEGDTAITVSTNAYYNSGWKYLATAAAGQYYIAGGAHTWNIAASGTAGNPITFTQAMTLDASGNLGVGTTSPSDSAGYTGKILDVAGPGYFRQNGDATKYVSIGTSGGITYIEANGTGNQIVFLTSASEKMRLDNAGNLGLGGAPASAVASSMIQVGITNQGAFGALVGGPVDHAFVSGNAYPTSSNDPGFTVWKSRAAGAAALYEVGRGGQHIWYKATGLSAGATITFTQAMILDSSSNLTATGNVTAYSDERLKSDWSELPEDFVAQLASVKSGTYTRIDNGLRQIGVSAQSLQPVAPEGVLDGEHLSVAYGNVALAAAVALAKKVVALEARLAALEA